jgi:hypothetical protein
MISKSAKAGLALLLMSSAGCNAIQDHCINFETDTRNMVLAEKGWLNWSSCYKGINYRTHFAKGFKDGYTNVLEGGKGCQPTLPPRCYWKPQFQTADCRAKINAWFDGYSHGATAAQQDGLGSLQQLPISPTARANLMARQAPPSASCFSGMSKLEDTDPVHHPDVHGENSVDEPPMEILKTPEMEVPPEPNILETVRPYDEGTSPVEK